MEINLTHREQSKMDFIDSLMAFNSKSIGPMLKHDYQDIINRRKLDVNSVNDVSKVMKYSHLKPSFSLSSLILFS